MAKSARIDDIPNIAIIKPFRAALFTFTKKRSSAGFLIQANHTNQLKNINQSQPPSIIPIIPIKPIKPRKATGLNIFLFNKATTSCYIVIKFIYIFKFQFRLLVKLTSGIYGSPDKTSLITLRIIDFIRELRLFSCLQIFRVKGNYDFLKAVIFYF